MTFMKPVRERVRKTASPVVHGFSAMEMSCGLHDASGEAVTCCTLWLSAPPRSNYPMFSVRSVLLAGAGGFEPPHGGIKIHCLTTWRRPIKLSGKRRDQPSADSLQQRRSIEGVEPFQQPRARNSG